MTMYFFYQPTAKTTWKPALATERDAIIREKKPELVSVLDVDHSFTPDPTPEELLNLRYAGPFYADWDAADIEEAITQFKVFLTNLKAKGVDLSMLKLFATGGKGFHLEMPAQMFMGKIPSNGSLNLPYIYKEMAHEMFVDTLDLRVYTAKRGRQWRCPNVKRENDLHKVQITADEAMAMTPELYKQVCGSPRNELPLTKPALNSEMALLFAQSRDKVDRALVKRKNKKPESDKLKKFKGEWPETLQLILSGVGLKEGVGWNYISFQLAVVASTLGKTEEQLMADAAQLIESHVGDSGRYGTPRLRQKDLREMFRYVNGSPVYEYSVGGVMALLMPEIRANADIAFGDWVPDEKPQKAPKPKAAPKPTPVEGEAGEPSGEAGESVEESEPEEPEIVEEEEGNQPLRIGKAGVFFRTDDGYKNVCDIGMLSPISMRKLNGEHIGYEITAWLDGKPIGEHFIPMSAFTSKAQFNNWSVGLGASMRASDIQTTMLVDYFRKKTKGNPVFAVEREGVDVIQCPTEKGRTDVIWAAPDAVISNNPAVTYRYHGIYNNQGTYKSDLMTAGKLVPEDVEFINHLLNINTPSNLAKLLGWFSAAFMTQFIRRKFKRFPSLQLFGQAGAGKSMTVILLNHMHYNQVEPRQFAVAGQTMFPLIVAVATSASIPLVFEELKSRELTKTARDFLKNMLRSNYTADQLQRGSLGRDKTSREPTVTDFSNAAPIAFVGEAIEDQAAILERCVVVALSKANQKGREASFEYCMNNPTVMGKIGKAIVEHALKGDRELLYNDIAENFKVVSGLASAAMIDGASRPAFNLAVVLAGLKVLHFTLKREYGDVFDERFQTMRESLLDNIGENIPKNMSEASRVLDTLSLLSRNPDPQFQMRNGVDYTIAADGKTMDLKLRTAYAKYVRYQRGLGMEVLFDNENAFLAGMANYGGTMRKACPDNHQLYDSPGAVIYRLNLEYLQKEGVDAFK